MMVTQASLARRLRHIEARIGDAGDEMVYVTRGMKGLHEALRDLEERRNPDAAPQGPRGTAAILADIERVQAMIEAREAANPPPPEEPITPLPRVTLPRPAPPPHYPHRPPPRAPAPPPKAAPKPKPIRLEEDGSPYSDWNHL